MRVVPEPGVSGRLAQRCALALIVLPAILDVPLLGQEARPIAVGGEGASSATDLVAEQVYFLDQPRTGNLVTAPVAGQAVYAHVDYTISGASNVSGTLWRIELDGVTLCTGITTLTVGSWRSHCNNPWTVTNGPHTLRAVMDPLGTIAEASETNNVVSRDYLVPLVELSALRVDLREQRSAATAVDEPVEGQQLYPHLEYRVTAPGQVSFVRGIELDGQTLCEATVTADAGVYTASCPTPWIVTQGAHGLRGYVDPAGTVTELDEGDNEASRNYLVPLVELTALDVYFSAQASSETAVDEPAEGQQLYPHVKYRVTAPGQVTLVLRIELDGQTLCQGPVSIASSGEYWSWCPPWIVTRGLHTLRGFLDPADTIEERDEGDNTISRTHLVPVINLRATSVYFSDQQWGDPTVVREGEAVYPTLAFTQTAPGTVTHFVRILLDGNVLCQSNVSTTNANTRISCSAWTATEGPHSLYGELDALDVLLELDENDNEAWSGITIAPEVRIEPLTIDVQQSTEGGARAPTAALGRRPTTRIDPRQLDGLLGKARERGSLRVLVGLDAPFVPEGLLADAARREAQRATIAAMQQTVLERMAGTKTKAYVRFRFIPHLALEVDAEALAALAALKEVTSIGEDVPLEFTLASSNAVIGSPAAWAAGYTGSGQVVAVIDSGVDLSHSFFAGRIVSEACYGTNDPGQNVFSNCPGGATESTAPGSGDNCPTDAFGCEHGTHVAGIVLANDPGNVYDGVAPAAELVAIKVASLVYGGCPPFYSRCARPYEADVIRGLERVYEIRNDFNIVAANVSIGGGKWTNIASCDADNMAYRDAVANVRSVGIAPVIASGNSDYRDGIARPACTSSAVSVGATEDDDDVAQFSNVAPFLSLLAPGEDIDSAVPGGIGNLGGTSMAAPHVAGAWALIRQAQPTSSVDDTLEALRASATSVDDRRPGGFVRDMRRINVDQAVQIPPGPRFIIHNSGNGILDVSSIALDSPAGWIGWSPDAPFVVPPGESRTVQVSIDFAAAPRGQSTRRLLVDSDDADESPYPGGVDVVVTRAPGPPEIHNVLWPLRTKMTWDPAPTAVEYHVYRDALGGLGPGSFGVCRDHTDPDRTDTQIDDADPLAPGAGFVYLVSGEDSAGIEGTLGFAGGIERTASSVCP